MAIYGLCVLLLMTTVSLPRDSSFVGASAMQQHNVRGALRSPPNVRVTDDRFVAHAEPYLAVNPRDPRNLLGATQYLNGSALALAGTFVSFNGGRSWRDDGPLPMPSGFSTSLDVTIVFDTAGNAVVAALLGNATRDTFSSNRGVAVWRTVNGGRSFSRPVVVVKGQFADHPWLAIDPPTTVRGHVRPQVMYLAWANQNGLSLSRSTDDGRHFAPARTIPRTGQLVGDPVLTGRTTQPDRRGLLLKHAEPEDTRSVPSARRMADERLGRRTRSRSLQVRRCCMERESHPPGWPRRSIRGATSCMSRMPPIRGRLALRM